MRILWAVDPFADDASLEKTMGRLLRSLSAGTDAKSVQIEPIHAFSAASLGYPSGYFTTHRAEIEGQLAARVERVVKGLGLPGLAAPRLVEATGGGIRSAVAGVLDWGRRTRADLIAVTTRAGGLRRLALGSFAETLALQSDVPLVVVGSGMRVGTRLDEVILPTDLGPGHERGFKRALALAHRHGARLTVLHVSEYLAHHPEATFGPPGGYEEAVAVDSTERRARLEALAEEARKGGVDATAVLVEDQRSPGAAIVQLAQERRSGLVAMVSHHSRLESRLLGSVTRYVLRHSPLPVWTVHEEG